MYRAIIFLIAAGVKAPICEQVLFIGTEDKQKINLVTSI